MERKQFVMGKNTINTTGTVSEKGIQKRHYGIDSDAWEYANRAENLEAAYGIPHECGELACELALRNSCELDMAFEIIWKELNESCGEESIEMIQKKYDIAFPMY